MRSGSDLDLNLDGMWTESDEFRAKQSRWDVGLDRDSNLNQVCIGSGSDQDRICFESGSDLDLDASVSLLNQLRTP